MRIPLRFDESYEFAAPVERVWETLLDPESIAGCIPGVHSVEKVAEDEYRGKGVVHVGPFPVTLSVHVTVRDKVPAASCSLAVLVEGGGSTAEASVRLRLEGSGSRTTLKATGEAEAGGLLTGFAGRAAGDTAGRFLREFFTCLQDRCLRAGP